MAQPRGEGDGVVGADDAEEDSAAVAMMWLVTSGWLIVRPLFSCDSTTVTKPRGEGL